MSQHFSYDIFISHAFEDKTDFVNSLATELIKANLKVWYSGFNLKSGDSITSEVNNALRESAFAIVVISPKYLEKQWTMNELNALFSQKSDKNRILVILHGISADEVITRLPILADRYAISSAKSMDYIVKEIFRAIKSEALPANKSIATQKTGKVPAMKKNNSDKGMVNSNVNKHTTNVNVNTGGKAILFVLVLIVIVLAALYFFTQGNGVDKSHVIPSNSN